MKSINLDTHDLDCMQILQSTRTTSKVLTKLILLSIKSQLNCKITKNKLLLLRFVYESTRTPHI